MNVGRSSALLLLCALALTVCLCAGTKTSRRLFHPRVPASRAAETDLPGTANCTERFIEQPLQHFSFESNKADPTVTATYGQRYYTYAEYWNKSAKGPIFFYTGNEADVGLYVNATGLMWENAREFGAYLVFAEHRFYGASLPADPTDTQFLSHELALADFAVLIQTLREELGAHDSPFIAFGGSYGGKLAAWLRMKYPAAVAGAISASAPLLAFPGELPAWDSQSYYRVVSNTARHYSDACADNVKAAFPLLERQGATADGRQQLQSFFRLCEAPIDEYKVSMLKFFIRDAFDFIAMGNYPFPSDYIGGTAAKPLPAWPMQKACSYLDDASLRSSAKALFPAVLQAVSVLLNVTGTETCFDLPDYPTSQTPEAPMDGLWDWQWCTEQLPDSYWYSTDGQRDMFWDNPYNRTLIDLHCELVWGVRPRREWIVEEYGGRNLGAGHSNIVFSSGGFDGWSSAGVATNLSDSLVSIFIPDGGHHLDLFFSHPDDPASVLQARKLELTHVKRWIEEFSQRKQAQSWGDLL